MRHGTPLESTTPATSSRGAPCRDAAASATVEREDVIPSTILDIDTHDVSNDRAIDHHLPELRHVQYRQTPASFFTTAQAVERFCAQSPAIAAYFVPLETFHVRQFRKRSKRMVVARRQSTLQGTLDWHWGCGPARHSRESNGALTGASGEYLTGQPFVQCITMPATAPMNNKMQAVDWMKKPGKRFSTALL
jgi:hypothetical protein